MYKIAAFFILVVLSITGNAQTYYWIGFTDKSNSIYSVSKPEEFLSERAIQRRVKQGIEIDELDLPVNKQYIDQVVSLGADFIHSSKWMNGITVRCDSLNFTEQVSELHFVQEVQVTKRNLISEKSAKSKFYVKYDSDQNPIIDSTYYGASVYQLGQLNGQYLHNNDFKGEGMHIAVIDAGFYKANEFPVFDSLWINNRILGTKDFVTHSTNIFDQHYHGMSVLSIMGGNAPGVLVGTAPEASFWLLRSEDVDSEFLIEEDNWIAAAEFADSVGADVINSSLGYYLFDDSTMNHSYADMDGSTTRVTRGANIAASRGLIVVVSAGNEGNDPWKYIIAPSDGDNVIGVAATDRQNKAAFFTSYGPASDGDVKPNVAAIGLNTIVQRSNGNISTGNGTSYSGPVIAGMTACLWQANPNAKAFEVKDALEKSAHLYSTPDSLLGYGIPDFMLADQILKLSGIESHSEDLQYVVFPNPFSERIIILNKEIIPENVINIKIFDVTGRILKEYNKFSDPVITLTGLSVLRQGFYSLLINTKEGETAIKLIK